MNTEALKLCPVFNLNNGKYIMRMTVCDAEQFLSAELYYTADNTTPEHYARALLTSEEYIKWLKQLGITFTSTASITKVERAYANNYAVSVSTTQIVMLERAYTKEQAEHQARRKSATWFIDCTYTAERI